MAHPGPNQGWLFDDRRQQYYRYDSRTDQLVYADGTRFQRPSHLPRTSFESVATQTPLSPSQAAVSPTQQPRHYDHVSRNQPVSPPLDPRTASFRAHGPSSSGAQANQTAENASRSTTGQGSSQTTQNEPVLTRTLNAGGVPVISSTDRRNLVETRVATGPENLITDPTLLGDGVTAQRALYGTDGAEERLFSTFKVREKPQRFFKVGRVFLILWTEPAGAGATAVTSYAQNDRTITAADRGLIPGRFGEKVYSQVRRFVVIREGAHFCSALPIYTYGGQGVGKQSVRKSDHVIIYTSKQAPRPLTAELSKQGEPDEMRPTPVRVVPDSPADILSSTSRLDLAKVHTIHHNIKVKPLGEVHPNSIEAFKAQFASVWGLQSQAVAGPSQGRRLTAAREPESTAGAAGADGSDESSDESEADIGSSPPPPRRRGSAATTARPQFNSSPPTSPMTQPAQPARTSNTGAQQGQDVRSTLAAYMQQGHSREQAFELVVRRFMAARPELGRQAVVALLHSQLNAATAGPSAVRSRGGDENNGDDSSEADDDGSDDDDESDAEDNDNGRRGQPARR
ncbi:hypothetical protein LTR56_011206 [Elasticomyces elasticus]|nr:hypothetical protein LTR56_011206 [Elasticomyces elasticus]KAK3650429.1 hypothetical protein LTR22_012520 [Elasticomyces elasticus]KAK4921838.1 hypothetical protein LTR49_010776 [Elasticomyces elasticus]KAK5753446.1 hypothetical protein LTS12_016497 [Elasticomyces elasticus]